VPRKKPSAKKPHQKARLKRAQGREAKPLSSVGEFGLIELIARQSASDRPDVQRAIGDDAAVFAGPGPNRFLVTTDVLNESVHFSLNTTSPYLLGRKSLAVNLSDIAAMGGIPLYFFVGLSVPGNLPVTVVHALYRGMHSQAGRFNVALLGGDTVAASGGLSISITLIGKAHPRRILYRSGARPGDLIYVSGTLGDSALGLVLLHQGARVRPKQHLMRRHLDPEPRIELGQALAEARLATSMIDISDGVVADLGHILEQSNAGAELHCGQIPLSQAYRRECPRLFSDMYAPALSGGEDYELLFTAAPRRRTAVETLARTLGIALTCIGSITGDEGTLRIIDEKGKVYKLEDKGFRHF
jgi:thiamine-monophosphate kinase